MARLTGNTLLYHRGPVVAEPDEAEQALLGAVSDVLKGTGIEVVTDVDEGQRVLDAANGNDAKLEAKKRRALETVSVSRNVGEKHPQTAISSADGAKVLKNLDALADNYENSSSTNEKTFIGEVAKSLGINAPDKSSKYATFETKNGKVVTVRFSNHNAKVSNFDANGEADGISIVVSAKKSNGITNDGDAHVTEYYYDAIKLRKAEGKPLAEVAKSIKQLLYSGEFKDPTGLAEVQEVNAEDIARFQKVYHGSHADFDHFDHSHMGEGEGAQAKNYVIFNENDARVTDHVRFFRTPDSKDVHLAVLKVLPDVLRESVDAEQHPDYNKGADGVRSAENGINPDVTIHRLYGAVTMGERLYRVKVTLKENTKDNEAKKAYSYEATKIELLEDTSSDAESSRNLAPSNSKSEIPAGQHGKASGLTPTFPRYSDKSITAANLLQGVEKSYGGGKFFEDEGKPRTGDPAADADEGKRFRLLDDDDPQAQELEALPESEPRETLAQAMVRRVKELAAKLGVKVQMACAQPRTASTPM